MGMNRMGILDYVKEDKPKKIKSEKDLVYWGIDTETYVEGDEYGLISIQIWNPTESRYFSHPTYDESESEIRLHICNQFFNWMNGLNGYHVLAFFNMDFDFSQFSYNLINNSPWTYEYDNHYPKKGTISILESDSNIYKCTIETEMATIIMIDIANFLTATNLDTACRQWINEQKIDLDTKRFPKKPASDLEKSYAMHDAEITQKLCVQLLKSEVLEGVKYITIAGRTLGHFRDFIKQKYGLTFDEFAYGTDDKELIESYKEKIEKVMRPFTRGGICRAFQTGLFKDCHHIDARSMYPSQMDLEYIPHGALLDEPPKDKRYATIYFPVGRYELRADKISNIQFRTKAQCQQYAYHKIHNPAEYVDSVFFDGTFPIWEMEYQIFKECFQPVGEVDDSKRLYIEMKRNVVLKAYIEMLYEGKTKYTGTKKYYYKILMNSLYGKFLSRPDGTAISYESGRHKVAESDRPTYYLPLGNWIAMMGRVSLMKCLLSIPKENLIYCDTDSCIYKGEIHPSVEIGKNLGQWGIENDDFDCWVVGPKTYQELNHDGSLITKCAGLSNDVRQSIGFMELQEDKVYHVHKARRNKTNWAIEIRPIEFKISIKAQALKARL